MHQPVSPNFVRAYVQYVCPIKQRPLTAKLSCLDVLRAPPVEVQEAVVELVERAHPLVRPALMASLVEDRVDDAKFIVEHEAELVRFAEISATSAVLDPRSEGLGPFDGLGL